MSSTPDLSHTIAYQLNVRLVEQTCLFELAWGQGQQLSAQLQYPMRLSVLYREWRFVYLSFYQNLDALDDLDSQNGSAYKHLRGRVADSGSIESPLPDWHAKLVTVEAELLSEFHNWLRSRELFEIRTELVRVRSQPEDATGKGESIVDVLVTCGSSDLARLPWEAWEIGTELAAHSRIRIFRTPSNIRLAPQRSKSTARVLAILGDDTGLNFAKEREALTQCQKQVQLTFVGWQPGKSIAELKAEIRSALRDPQGWDVLLFFGHSNETGLTGGVISIAPDAQLQIHEITEDLKIAKDRGLQFALFNSCSGLSIADALINLGLSQVVVMREAIHNNVAQEFLVQFLHSLANYQDAYDSLRSACKFLKLEQNLTYPSAYLIPSLFRHPAAEVFRLQRKPTGWQRAIELLRPTKLEAIALPILLFFSCSVSSQDALVAQRLLVQSIYRDRTDQIEPISAAQPPPVLLVQIDEESIRRAKITDIKPLDRKYVATIIPRLAALNAKVVGLDLLFKNHIEKEENTAILAQTIKKAVSEHRTWFVFAAYEHGGNWLKPLPEITNPHWSLFGDIELLLWSMKLAPRNLSSTSPLPFSYNLALAHHLTQTEEFLEEVPQPNLRSSSDFLSQIDKFVQFQKKEDYTTLLPSWSRSQPITLFSYRLQQLWFHPIIDFSVPPNRAYDTIPAWKLLESDASTPQLQAIDRQVVVLAAGGFAEAGLFSDGQDNHRLPPAIAYWHDRTSNPTEIFTGGEAHAYMIHHLLRDRLVVPVPDLWAVAAAILLGKGMVVVWRQKHQQLSQRGTSIVQGSVAIAPIVYGAASLQIFVSAAILLPWVLPSTAFWIYTLPILLRKKTV